MPETPPPNVPATPPAAPPAPPAEPPKEPAPPATPPAEPPATPSESPKEPPKEPETPPADPPKDLPKADRVVPKTPEEYKLPEHVPPQVAKFAHENDMTQAQLDSTLKYYGEMVNGARQAEATAMRQHGDALVASWGDNAQHNLSLVRRALAQNDPNGELKQVLEESGYGNHPAVLKFFLKIGTYMQEGGFLKGNVNTPPGKRSAAQTLFGKTHPSQN